MKNQWLRTLGEILWDFSKLTMKFRSPKGEVVLKGLSKPRDKVIEEKILRWVSRKHTVGAFVQLAAIEVDSKVQNLSL